MLKERFDVEDQAFLRKFVAIDETWIKDAEPELKSQSNERRATGSPRHKKRAQSKVQLLMIFTYDHQGVIMTDTVPCERSVTGVYYCAFTQKFHSKRQRTDFS